MSVRSSCADDEVRFEPVNPSVHYMCFTTLYSELEMRAVSCPMMCDKMANQDEEHQKKDDGGASSELDWQLERGER